MSEPTDTNRAAEEAATNDSERTKQVATAGWTAGLSAMFLVFSLTTHPTSWPLAIGVIGIAAMVATACYFMLRKS